MGASASRATQTIEKQFETQIENVGATQICKNKIEGDVRFKNCDGCNFTQACMLSQENSFQVLVDAITETLAENTADALAGFGISATDSDQVIREKIMNKISNDCGRQESENIIAGNVYVEDSKNFIFNQSGDLNMDCVASNITKAIAKTQASNTSKATGASLASFLGGRGGLTGLITILIIGAIALGLVRMTSSQKTENKPKKFYIIKFLLYLIIIACAGFYIWYMFADIKGENGSDVKEKNPFAWELKMWIPAFALIISVILLYLLPNLISDVQVKPKEKEKPKEDDDSEDDIEYEESISDIKYPTYDEYLTDDGYSTDEF